MFCLRKDDLWDALVEYPEAKQKLIQRGQDLLRKDNLLDEQALMKLAKKEEEVASRIARVDSSLDTLQTRFARLLSEFNCSQMKLKRRISKLEKHYVIESSSTELSDIIPPLELS